jgi:DNA modification methylase
MDLIFTDPPYAIDIHSNAMTIGGKTSGENNSTGFTYDDNFENVKPTLLTLIKESFRITKETGHAIFFCGKDRFIFQFMYDNMVAAGWNVLQWPIIWIKQSSGQNNQPDRWPSSAYEAILFARKPLSTLVLQGKPDWIQCDIVTSGDRTHQAEKPTLLCKEIISRVCTPGQSMYDPFMGSGALVEAGLDMKLYVSGCEKLIESYALAMNRILKWKEKK